MTNRLVAVDDANYLLPEPVLDALAADIVDTGGTLNAGVVAAVDGAVETLTVDSNSRESLLRARAFEILGPLSDAIRNRQNKPVNILAIGDSVTEGSQIAAQAGRWIDKLANRMRRLYPTPGAPGVDGQVYYPGHYQTGSRADLFTNSVPGGVTTGNLFGLGLRYLNMTTGGVTEVSFTGTGFELSLVSWNATGPMTIEVDSVVVGTATAWHPITTFLDGYSWSHHGLTYGPHTVKITAGASTIRLGGMSVYNGDEVSGIRVYDSGHTGYKASDFNAQDWDGAISWADPDLVLIGLGFNEIGTGVPVATFKAEMISLVAKIRAATTGKDPAICLLQFWPSTTYPLDLQLTFKEAITEIVTADPTLFRIDLSEVVDSMNDPLNLIADNTHPNSTGSLPIAEYIATYLQGAIATDILEKTPAPTAYSYDVFGRVFGHPGYLLTGQKWEQTSGRWVIDHGLMSSMGYVSGATLMDRFCTMDDGEADGTITVEADNLGAHGGIVFRVDAAGGNAFWFGRGSSGTYAFQPIAGGVAGSATTTAVNAANGDTIQVVLAGTSIICKVNGVALVTTTSAVSQTSTRHGVYSTTNGTSTRVYTVAFSSWKHEA